MTTTLLDAETLMSRLTLLGDIGRDGQGGLTRLAATDADKAARDQLVDWFREAGLEIHVDRIGNIFGVWPIKSDTPPLMMGSHIDSVVNAGIYDGCYGVLAALSVVEAMQQAGVRPDRSLVIGIFTNEEGARFAPDMMGSLVYAGGLGVELALQASDANGAILGEELSRIGYAGEMVPGAIVPSAFLELHIEQGPVLEHEGCMIGAVTNLQGISWQKVRIKGIANHAGTTPTRLRADAGLAAAKVIVFLRELVAGSDSVATVGTIRFSPEVINVVPACAELTVDLRDPDETILQSREIALAEFLKSLEDSEGLTVETERLARSQPVRFDERLVQQIEQSASARSLSCRRITSGAGHDAQMMARICPAAMIFVPSKDGISHNPREHTDEVALIAGAHVLLDTACRLVVKDCCSDQPST